MTLIIGLMLVSLLFNSDAFVIGGRRSGNAAAVIGGTQRGVPPHRENVACRGVAVEGMWTSGLSYGKGPFRFYRDFEDWMKPFPPEDRDAYPEVFNLPEHTYEVSLNKPLGIVFEELDSGRGVVVIDLVEGGNAAMQGMVKVGDRLTAMTAVKIIGAKWERRLIPALDFDFDTVVGAIGSNDPKWGCEDCVLQLARPEADEAKIRQFMEFFNPPGDSPWRQRQ
eukprot:CAMPEP_0118705270 /NCGR_PEP_ID=MMETSP0800-20121206/19774_1 /TAXON_ID=210618 ORGANISM="Striatella unipunctata, Strain CCMP2910" /NCGR_SAMPLE_ID=MMETSP0800 /ASSEMBLY_ACC=CAM_ASM_000638 /LENGTH=222 /DNA_ID=CAMNT_0006607405 /DNA_START=23 /DNA_END=691 /DNA_ORIENTATION=+